MLGVARLARAHSCDLIMRAALLLIAVIMNLRYFGHRRFMISADDRRRRAVPPRPRQALELHDDCGAARMGRRCHSLSDELPLTINA